MLTKLSHQELNLLLFALEGAKAATVADSAAAPACEESCPIVDHLDEMFGEMTVERKLINHLNNHLREGMFECGFLEIADKIQAPTLSAEDQLKLEQMNTRLRDWNCDINLEAEEKKLLHAAVNRLPRSAWLVMPKTLWRLRKKLRTG
ncbi:MAG: hypothetical protein AB1757_18540 [Acidobacteriota bacterium]